MKDEPVKTNVMIDGRGTDEDLNYDLSLRPRGFDEYIGQEQVKENLKVSIAAARGRNDVLDHIMFRQGPAARSIKLDLKRFTLVGATTRSGLLTSPLRDRFGQIFRLDFYDAGSLTRILPRSTSILGVTGELEGIGEIARRARGTPRIANRLLRRVRDYAQVRANGVITRAVTEEALRMLEVDPMGLDKMDTMLLVTMIDKFAGGPGGGETLGAAIGGEKETIEDVYEPFLIQAGFL